jgi:hypothetical protein
VAEPEAVVVGCHWQERRSELAFVTRSIAGAASRHGPVSVLVPGPAGLAQPDGAFDLEGIGDAGDLRWPGRLASVGTVVVDQLTPEVAALLSGVGPRAVLSLCDLTAGGPHAPSWRRLQLVPTRDGDASLTVTVHVPVNPLAELHRHHGFGFTGYLIVLSGRSGEPEDPPPAVAWLSAAFPEADIILVEDAVASAWKGRALRGKVHVDTRMDFWRLVAHAAVCIDLAPGPHIARECIESLRFGTPIIAPEDSGAAATHAHAGGGSTFGDPAELIDAAAHLQDGDNRSAASDAGRRYADAQYGDAAALVERVRVLLTHER